MKNLLTEKPTNWKIWYAIIPIITFILASLPFNLLSIAGSGENMITSLIPLLQFVIWAIMSFLIIRLLIKRRFTAEDLCFDKKTFTKRNTIIIISVFIITHLLFYVFSKISGRTTNAAAEFINSGFGKNLYSDIALIIGSTIFAPVFEELIYRGIMLRSVHDGLYKYFPNNKTVLFIPSIFSITLIAILFIMPHVSDMNVNVFTISYFVTSAGFSLVYMLTGSMVSSMVSHSLQSCVAFSQLIIYGHGNYQVSPIVYAITFLCPFIVFVIGSVIKKSFEGK